MKNSNRSKAIIFLWNALKEAEHFHNKHWKNIFKHSLWVYNLLDELWYSEDICIAWLLHDILEDTNVDEKELREEFWEKVTLLVQANTMDKTMWKHEMKEYVVSRCIESWEDALCIKVCDIYDSYVFYQSINNVPEAERSVSIKEIILNKNTSRISHWKTKQILESIV